MRRLGGSTLSPVGTLSSSHSILALTPSRNPPVSACANYTCANQPTSNEADLSSSLQRGLNHSCPLRTEAGWSVDLLSVSTTILTLLNYAEALTNFRPPMLYNPLLAQERESPLIGSSIPVIRSEEMAVLNN